MPNDSIVVTCASMTISLPTSVDMKTLWQATTTRPTASSAPRARGLLDTASYVSRGEKITPMRRASKPGELCEDFCGAVVVSVMDTPHVLFYVGPPRIAIVPTSTNAMTTYAPTKTADSLRAG